VLCFAPLIDPFSRFGGELLASRHRDRTWILATATTMASFLVFGVLLTTWLGPMGMAYANFVPLGALVMFVAVRGLGRVEFRRLGLDLLRIYLLPVPWFAAAYLAFDQSSPLRPLASLAALAITATLYWRRFGEDFREFFRTARQM
jgi:O-antigen/teichoic acid export membrane protein